MSSIPYFCISSVAKAGWHTYAVDGKQYVAVAVGGGTTGQRHIGQLYPELKAAGGSNVLMVFALGEDR